MVLALKNDGQQAELYILGKKAEIITKKVIKQKRGRVDVLDELKKFLGKTKQEIQHFKKIIVFKGLGSFTSLRNAIAVANTISQYHEVPITGQTGENWIENGLKAKGSKNTTTPFYGALPNITLEKKKF